MRDLSFIRAEIDRMRVQVGRQRREIVQLQRAGVATEAAKALLERMLMTLDDLREQRERLKLENSDGVPRRRAARHG
ncbi:hypothetical protein HL666_19125 [Bradyrhizobium sp. 83002]|uniref:hypothetical protein n=1 Tax=Bradyrhizobium aeschynomenes TaxID=2734909 RepID=UPI0015563DF5|nr:hypothetical protein [Bradyrhizobium aeschynomenes]NPU12886.1 hypothetical protein [Bradyrhizobium aeschynomenes]